MRTELESGAWVDHAPAQELKAKDKDAVDRCVRLALEMSDEGRLGLAGGQTLDAADIQITARDAVWARIITDWSFDVPVPEIGPDYRIAHQESIGELGIDDFNDIEQLLAPMAAKLRRRPDPKGGTTSSSNGSSRASAARPSRKG